MLKKMLDILELLMHQQHKKETPKEKPLPKPPCPSCKATIYDLIKIGKLGCDECWNHYRDELIPVLMKNQGSIKHVGKKPQNRKENLEELKKKLSEAVKIENYEAAAIIKKKIENLKI